jgi:hypothetical protein
MLKHNVLRRTQEPFGFNEQTVLGFRSAGGTVETVNILNRVDRSIQRKVTVASASASWQLPVSVPVPVPVGSVSGQYGAQRKVENENDNEHEHDWKTNAATPLRRHVSAHADTFLLPPNAEL